MKFGRKRGTDETVAGSARPTDADQDEIDAVLAAAAAHGPVDISEVDETATYIDLGSMLVQLPTELDLRLQVDDETGTVLTVLLVGAEGVLEMRAFAAARGGDLWSEARHQIAADTTQRGGTASEQEGPFGTELYCEVPVVGPDGQGAIQQSRVIGCSGPRWFVRATLAGLPAVDPEQAAPYEAALRSLAVRRGNEAMAPGQALPLRLPPEARPATADELGPTDA